MLTIKLIIKASNQNVEDQSYECDKDWTIYKLKEYISENYPTKPDVFDQRIIYSGYILKNDQVLFEIFEDDGSDYYIIHLVCNVNSPQQTSPIHIPCNKETIVENVNETSLNFNSLNNYSNLFTTSDSLNTEIRHSDIEDLDVDTINHQMMIMQMILDYMRSLTINGNNNLNEIIEQMNQRPEQSISLENHYNTETSERDFFYWIFTFIRVLILILIIFYSSIYWVIFFAFIYLYLYYMHMGPQEITQEQRNIELTASTHNRISFLGHCRIIFSVFIGFFLPYNIPHLLNTN